MKTNFSSVISHSSKLFCVFSVNTVRVGTERLTSVTLLSFKPIHVSDMKYLNLHLLLSHLPFESIIKKLIRCLYVCTVNSLFYCFLSSLVTASKVQTAEYSSDKQLCVVNTEIKMKYATNNYKKYKVFNSFYFRCRVQMILLQDNLACFSFHFFS